MRTVIGRTFVFESAHQLNGEVYGKCGSLHGHRYELTVEIEGEVNQFGWICDFAELDEVAKGIIEKFDHQNLNRYFEVPTVENIAKYVFETFDEKLKTRLYSLSRVLLYETAECYAEVTR
ncbi:MAG: 6-pyruvoyl trahydropterin synthase family protein [Candidatus Kryptoniota bacterium]